MSSSYFKVLASDVSLYEGALFERVYKTSDIFISIYSDLVPAWPLFFSTDTPVLGNILTIIALEGNINIKYRVCKLLHKAKITFI